MRLQMSKMQAKAKTSPKCLNLDPTKVFTRSALTLSEMIYHARVADDAATNPLALARCEADVQDAARRLMRMHEIVE